MVFVRIISPLPIPTGTALDEIIYFEMPFVGIQKLSIAKIRQNQLLKSIGFDSN